jgi:hypothetical protein
MPHHPKARGEVMDNLAPTRLDTLADDSVVGKARDD